MLPLLSEILYGDTGPRAAKSAPLGLPPGFYWVKCRLTDGSAGAWEVMCLSHERFYDTACEDSGWRPDQLAEIGPKIEPPVDAKDPPSAS